MSKQANQSINLPLTMSGAYVNSTLNAGLVGSTATGSLRFAAAGSFSSLLYAEQGTLAVDGLSVAILQPGVYQVDAIVAQAASASNTFALTFGATVVTNAAAPTAATAGLLQLVAGTITPLATAVSVPLSAVILVRLATAKTTPAVTSANTVRILATATAGGIVTNLTVAGCSISINRINDFNG